MASSAPIQPAPTMASRVPGVSSLRSSRASSRVRSRCWVPSPGRATGLAPVASTRASKAIPPPSVTSTPSPRPVARRASSARTPSPSRSARSVVSSSSPVISFLDSGGRSYGGWASAPTRVISPAKPRPRSSSMVRRPARPAPATTTCPGAVIWLVLLGRSARTAPRPGRAAVTPASSWPAAHGPGQAAAAPVPSVPCGGGSGGRAQPLGWQEHRAGVRWRPG